MNAKTWVVAVVGSVIALCGTSSTEAATSGNACSLLTPTQVSAVLSVPVTTGNNFGVPSACQWKGGAVATLRIVTFAIVAPQAFEFGKTFPSYSPKVSVAPVGGIGDDAYYLVTGPTITLGVKKGDTAFKVYFQHPGGLSAEQIKAMEKTLATAVLTAL